MGGKRVLLVEDNEQIMEGNRYFLRSRGYDVLTASSLREAQKLLEGERPNLIILDIMLPDGSGLEFLKRIRQTDSIPVLLLTGLAGSDDIVRGLSLGGDDYLTKPYDFSVMLSRVEALLRRAEQVPEQIEKGALRLDIISNQAFLNGEDLFLTPKQFALLLLLTRNAGKILSQEYLYETVWKTPLTSDSNALWKQMSHLKAKLSDSSGISLTAFRGEGYCLEIIKE